MKVALLSDCYLPRLGGIEVQTHDLARHLVALGHEVAVFTATPGPHGERHGAVTEVDGIPVHRLAVRLPWELPVNPLAPAELRRRLVAGGFDVAHIQTGIVSPFAWDSTRVTLGLGLPTAMTWHCMLTRISPVFGAAGFVRRWARRGVAMSAVSTVAAAPLRDLVGDAGQVSVLPNGIDVSRWRPAPTPAQSSGPATPTASQSSGPATPTAAQSSGPATPTAAQSSGPATPTPAQSSGPATPTALQLVTAMRLAARKRPVALVELVARAEQLSGPGSLALTILGEGPDRRKVESLVSDRGLGWVSLPGRVTRDELRQRYAAADVYLSPAQLESFGIAALEARTVGLPVIGRAGSGIGEYVEHEVNGLVVSSDSDMASAIARLARGRDQVARMRAWNIEHPPTQDWSSVAALAVAEYERAMTLARR